MEEDETLGVLVGDFLPERKDLKKGIERGCTDPSVLLPLLDTLLVSVGPQNKTVMEGESPVFEILVCDINLCSSVMTDVADRDRLPSNSPHFHYEQLSSSPTFRRVLSGSPLLLD